MLPIGQNYVFGAGRVFNLNSDPYIKGHSDLQHDEVAQAFLQAIQAGSAPIGSAPAPSSAPPPAPAAPSVPTASQTPDEGGATGFDPPDSTEGDADAGGATSLNALSADDSMPAPSAAPAASPTASITPPATATAATTAMPPTASAVSAPGNRKFDQTSLDASVIAIPLLENMGTELKRVERRMALRRRKEAAATPLTPQEQAELSAPPSVAGLPPLYDVIIDVNLNYTGGNPVGNVVAAAHDSDVAVRPDSAMPVSSRERAKDRIRRAAERDNERPKYRGAANPRSRS